MLLHEYGARHRGACLGVSPYTHSLLIEVADQITTTQRQVSILALMIFCHVSPTGIVLSQKLTTRLFQRPHHGHDPVPILAGITDGRCDSFPRSLSVHEC